jgi:acyl-coenzyme A synthetase/AMP-(fatty) acid ligase
LSIRFEIFGPLLKGIPSLVISDEILMDPHRVIQVLSGFHVTRIVLVPALLRILLDACRDFQSDLPELRIWLTSGENLPELAIEITNPD